MSGFMSCLGLCINCRRMFSFNPELVPSITVNGTREPVCESCMKQANALREKQGLPLHRIAAGAYEAEEV